MPQRRKEHMYKNAHFQTFLDNFGGCYDDFKRSRLDAFLQPALHPALYFKQFYKRFVFEKDEEGYVKKTQKNYMDVRVVLRLV